MARVSARSDDMLIIRGVNVFPSQLEELLLALPGFAPHYQLEISREAALDQLRVRVECVSALAADAARRASLATQLQGSVKDRIGISVEVAVEDPGSLERSLGKARRVIDRRR